MTNSNILIRKASAGTGKTFALAAQYVALLLHGESYKQILAVTFTNKATAEMKDRILTYLHAIADTQEFDCQETQGFLKLVRTIYGELGYHQPQLTDTYCQSKAAELYADILSHYDQMCVSTIDSFLQTLLAGMVQVLKGASGYTVELDSNTLISKATEQLLTDEADDQDTMNEIVRCMKEQMEEGNNWNIRASLISLAKELYKELLQQKSDQLVTDTHALQDLKDRVNWKKVGSGQVEELKQALARAGRFVAEDFSDGKRSFISRLDNYRACLTGALPSANDKVFTPFTDSVSAAIDDSQAWAAKYKGGEDVEAVRSEWAHIRDLAKQLRVYALRDRLITKHLNDLALMGRLQQVLAQILHDNNSRLLAETANILCKALKRGDAVFILEKAGIRYRHIMLDEFQDTSVLQWSNFAKLLEEILSTHEGSTLIVGDIKQSIYRWRNGDWTIMDKLCQTNKVQPMKCNFRSHRQVVQFNLSTFSSLIDKEKTDERYKKYHINIGTLYDEGYDGTNLSDYYASEHTHGFVQLRFYPQSADKKQSDLRKQVRTDMLTDMFDKMEYLLHQGLKAKDMLILIRNNAELEELLAVLDALQADGAHPYLQQVELVSNDSFKLEYSRSVLTIMQALRYIWLHDAIAGYYLQQIVGVDRLTTLDELRTTPMALSDMVEVIIRTYLCDEQGRFMGKDIAYVNSFRDSLRQYMASQGSDIQRFLQYWDDKLKQTAISASESDNIRVMTIHSSKGLEADNVFIPFCDWEMEEDRRNAQLWCEVDDMLVPIQQTATMEEIGFERDYVEEHILQRVDNINLLYVAFTRAAKRLYVWCDVCNVAKKDYTDYNVAQVLAEQYNGFSELNVRYTNKQWEPLEPMQWGEEFWDAERKVSKRITKPFVFQLEQDRSNELKAVLYSSESHICFRQSGDARKFGWTIADDAVPVMDSQTFGTVCHDIMSAIGLYSSVEMCQQAVKQRVADYYFTGKIPTEQIRDQIEDVLLQTVSHPQLQSWFTGDWHILREDTVLFPDSIGEIEERRMDRVMINGQQAVVLDYKFGADKKAYQKQLKEYMTLLRQMGYTEVSGFLWIAQEHKLEEVKS
ncbi:MAG: UvrD-helicase domain-containing protein [Paludibacteraceae bacterium]|nr:UvrD-helicase domain-containing protein [Paludibacteraceae bacterium]